VGGLVARAGFCESCGTNVYLTAEGACPRGHGREGIRDVYEVPDPSPMPNAGAAGDRPSNGGKTLLIVVAVVGLLLCCGVASLLSISVPVFNSARSDAQLRSCFANQRVIVGAALVTKAETDSFPLTITELVDSGYLKAVPACPGSGEYQYSPSTGGVTCTEHGPYEQ